MTIRTTGRGAGNSDVWAWGRFWEVGVALVGMCVKGGMEGVQTGLGELGGSVWFGLVWFGLVWFGFICWRMDTWLLGWVGGWVGG